MSQKSLIKDLKRVIGTLFTSILLLSLELAAWSTDRAVVKGWILPEDRDAMIQSCIKIAKKRGLC